MTLFLLCCAAVFGALLLISLVTGLSQRGAAREIAMNGIHTVGKATIQIAEGSARAGDRVQAALAILGASFINPALGAVAMVLGGLAYVIVKHFG